MLKWLKYLIRIIIPIFLVFLCIVGTILTLSDDNKISSIGTGLLSSSIVSIIIWIFQFVESINNRSNIVKNMYSLIKRELITKILMIELYLYNDTRTLCEYLQDLSKEASKCHNENKAEELMLYVERFIGTETFSGYTYQILRLLDYSLNQNLITMQEFTSLNSMFQYELSVLKLLKEDNKNETVCIFSYYIDSILRAINDNKNLSVFCNIVIKNDEFCIDAENLSKEDRVLFGVFSDRIR